MPQKKLSTKDKNKEKSSRFIELGERDSLSSNSQHATYGTDGLRPLPDPFNYFKDHHNYYDKFTHWLTRTSYPQKLILFLELKNRFLTEFEKQSADGEDLLLTSTPSQNNHIWLRGQAIPLADINKAAVAIRTTGFFQGVRNFRESYWPMMFYSLLAGDLASYFAYPEDRFGNTLGDIFLGLKHVWHYQPINQRTFTTYLTNFWEWPAALLVLPIGCGIYEMLKRLNWHKQGETLANLRAYEVGRCGDSVSHLLPFNRGQRVIDQAESLILWNRTIGIAQSHQPSPEEYQIIVSESESENQYENQDKNDGARDYVRAIIALANRSSGAAQLYALAALANIADGLNFKDLKKLQAQGVGVTELLKARTDCLKTLKHFAKFHPDGATRSLARFVYDNYLLWTLGRSQRRYLEPLFWGHRLMIMYAQIRLLQSFVQYGWTLTDWLIDKYQCQAQQKVWTYMSQASDYQCTVCGDHSDIYYKNVFDGQDCVDGFLVKPRGPEELTKLLKRVEPFGVQHISLSSQDWQAWSNTDLANVLDRVARSSSNHALSYFELSSSAFNPAPLHYSTTQVLVQFFGNVKMAQINLRNLGIGPNATAEFLIALTNRSVHSLDLSGNDIGQQGVLALTAFLPQAQQLDFLDLSSNSLSDADLELLAPALGSMNATRINLSNNLFGQRGLHALAMHLNNNKLIALDLSGNNFQGADLSFLAKFASNSSLSVVKLSNVQIGDSEFISFSRNLSNSTTSELDISGNCLSFVGVQEFQGMLANNTVGKVVIAYNGFGREGILYLSQALVNSSVIELDVSGNYIGDDGLQIFCKFLSGTQLQAVNLADNDLTDLEMPTLVNALRNSTITALNLAHNGIGDEGVSIISGIFSCRGNTIVSVNIADNKITAASIDDLSLALSSNASVVRELSLAGNEVGDSGVTKLTHGLINSTVVKLDLQETRMTAVGAQALASVLPNTRLKTINAGYNNVTSDGALAFAQALITHVPHESKLGATWPILSRLDEMRAIHQAASDTSMTMLNLTHNEVGVTGSRALCRVLPSTDIAMANLDLHANPIDSDLVDIDTCQISSASSMKPPLFGEIAAVFKLFRSDSFRHNCMSIPRRQPVEYKFDDLLQIVSETFRLQVATNFSGLSLIKYTAVFAFAFRQEAYGFVQKHLPTPVNTLLTDCANSEEGMLIGTTVELALRGEKALLSTSVITCKQAYQESTQQPNYTWSDIATNAAKGLLTLGGVYGIAYAVTVVTGSPLLGYLTIPFVANGQRMFAGVSESCSKHGLFAATERLIDNFAFSVPGGQTIARTLANAHSTTAK